MPKHAHFLPLTLSKPIRIEEKIPNAIRTLSKVSAKRNRERKLRVLGTDETYILVADIGIGLEAGFY